MTHRLRHYVCGSTVHDIGILFRDAGRDVRTFPSGAFLYEPGDGRRMLVDTGYAPQPWHTGWRGAVYRRVLPPTMTAQDDIAQQLADDGVAPESVTHLVLTHLHPDHIGGVVRFPSARIVTTAGQLETLRRARLRDAILPGLLPAWFPGPDPLVLDRSDFVSTEVAGVPLGVADPFPGAGLSLVDLPGHAQGHLGVLIDDRVLLAGDAAWGSDLLAEEPRMRAVPRALQHDGDAYRDTARRLVALSRAGIRVVCSHDQVGDRELLPR
ncbi:MULTISPECIES: MBL fold metallo-hydrolase [unclassified Microbacterium]|uniref:MBL fold metallo-hydrolase n=1 Tax=unclassified Microbacterium TaxID=2609290 RepID=UPI003650A43B